MKHILWLASWYPDKLQPLHGDFVERHARAASLYNRIFILHLVKDNKSLTSGKFHLEKRKYNDNCNVTILYYKPFSDIVIIEKLLSGLRYFIFFSELIREHIHEFGKPDLIHVHVSWRAGLLAWYFQWRYKVPYAVSEHWTIFLKEARQEYSSASVFSRWMIGRIFKRAKKTSAVSEVLSTTLAERFKIKKPFIVPNVVDTTLFIPKENKERSIFTFIHISELTKAKNGAEIIHAVKLLSHNTDQLFELVLYTPIDKSLIRLISALQLENHIRLEGYVPHVIIAAEMSKADCLILYSTYETFGCVVIEANACGLPVIVSDIPVMHEVIDNTMGIFVALNNPALLAEKMLWMMNNHLTQFNSERIVSVTEKKFGMKTIGERFDEFYKG
ncbi:MAG: glycosyltransferase [Flavitalea sp.]